METVKRQRRESPPGELGFAITTLKYLAAMTCADQLNLQLCLEPFDLTAILEAPVDCVVMIAFLTRCFHVYTICALTSTKQDICRN
mgnify:CR=1 FL=1